MWFFIFYHARFVTFRLSPFVKANYFTQTRWR